MTLRDVPSAFTKIGGMPARDVLAMALELQWIEATSADTIVLAESGRRLIDLPSHQARTRAVILDHIDILRPVWLQAALSGRSRVLRFAGPTIAQVFDEAGLVTGTDADTVAFWDALAARARGLENDKLTAIGRIGERATLEYERERTGTEPRWVALDNNADGYDVLSVVSSEDNRLLSIEVKATTSAAGGDFFLTRNEWERAHEAVHHVFHLWRVKDEAAVYPPTVVGLAQMFEHIPTNLGDGEWQQVMIPFAAFTDAGLKNKSQHVS